MILDSNFLILNLMLFLSKIVMSCHTFTNHVNTETYDYQYKNQLFFKFEGLVVLILKYNYKLEFLSNLMKNSNFII